MTKRSIIKFLEAKQIARELAAGSEYEVLHKQIMQKAYGEIGLTALADKIQPLLTEAERLWEDWANEHESCGHISFNHGYYTFIGMISRFTSSEGATLERITKESVMVRPTELESVRQEYTSQLRCIRETFNTVIKTVRGMTSVKQAAAYLKELGFDLSELESPGDKEQTALMIPVDTRFLFVKEAA